MIKIIGLAESIIGALMLDESLSPKFKKEIVSVIPKKESKINVNQSFNLTLRFLYTNGKSIKAPRKNLKKTKVNGGITSKVNL